jgi:phosphatidylglycerol lysyltransferase
MILKPRGLIQTQMPQQVEAGDEKHREEKSIPNPMLKKASLLLYAVSLAAIIASVAAQIAAPQGSVGTPISIELRRGAFTVFDFRPTRSDARALILFGSGDGGWSGFEEAVSKALQKNGYEVVGINSKTYAGTDYDLAILQADFGRIAQMAETHYGKSHPPPVVLGGWSMGAAQAIAAAGGPHPPQGLAGLLLLDPCSRGRYGLRLSDQSDVLPTGPGTFSMEEFAQTMGKLHVVQWHATQDSIDSRAWLDSLTAPHREFDFAKTGHYYNNDRIDFLSQLVDSVPWILSPEPNAITTTGSKR